MIRHLTQSQFVRFVATGGVAATVNFGSRIVLNRWMSFSVAVCLAYVAGMITAFVLARWLVFGAGEQSAQKSATIFVGVNLFAIAQTWLVTMALANYVLPAIGVEMHVREIAHAIGVLAPVFSSYFGHKRWSFR
ncbi:GtrA family protein [Luteibacter sp. ME-Dv--P-043b]|uniref:GtrA family protein n=1 Tax=Luteibacter sp. ME-Dv--P-043b TaxID=3040291 RepID=UPI002552A9F3|nr:GtrA family protein [Luteibacter sp. ME-Dv--P-043b]